MWTVRCAELGSVELEKFLMQGWEPFAVTHLSWAMNPMIYLRKQDNK